MLEIKGSLEILSNNVIKMSEGGIRGVSQNIGC
jgi:hypothetical protein